MSWGLSRSKMVMIDAADALPGRSVVVPVPEKHLVLGTPMVSPNGTCDWGPGYRAVVLGGGCFWGVEEICWQLPGVYTTAVGYAGGFTPNPTYEEVCTARTGHTEAVLVVIDESQTDLETILRTFFETHDPTQDMRQGNDIGTQYRSAVFTCSAADAQLARDIAERYQSALTAAGYGPIATEIAELADVGDGRFYYAEDYHQQYLAKNPHGYRCHASTGVHFPQ
ncbi:MAG: peptide-methionine (S)-S-oxide reductase MsrA [Gordonia sp. (in: high G+C Gram-positive bacteria)]|uniref:peptide-methionine (S)-S-oxide reductase MsrA n=1 Tax=Gordonia sp. (in: high G+C Gram-positive bacteria) TaxID=84139 RepID=UPI0039E65F1A